MVWPCRVVRHVGINDAEPTVNEHQEDFASFSRKVKGAKPGNQQPQARAPSIFRTMTFAVASVRQSGAVVPFL